MLLRVSLFLFGSDYAETLLILSVASRVAISLLRVRITSLISLLMSDISCTASLRCCSFSLSKIFSSSPCADIARRADMSAAFKAASWQLIILGDEKNKLCNSLEQARIFKLYFQ